MRTTLTLEPDVEAELRAAEQRTGAGRKAVINAALRRGLRQLEGDPSRRSPAYRTPPHDPGKPALEGVHSIHDLLAFAEGENFR